VKGVQDALRRLEGVNDIRVDLQSNLVTITPAPDVELALAAIPAAIRAAGFTPADMRIVARGTLSAREGGVVFRIRGWRAELPVRGELGSGGAGRPDEEVELRARVLFEDGLVLELL
jgi:hypothetical protein